MDASGGLLAQTRADLEALGQGKIDEFTRNLLAVGYLTRVFEAEGIRPIIVGGHAVEAYTQGSYTTSDVDLVLRGRHDAIHILKALGFEQATTLRHWYFPHLRLPLEIVDEDLAGSEAMLLRIDLPEKLHIYVIGIEDLVLDRARASLYWNSGSHRDWTVHLLALNIDQIDLEYLFATAEQEDPELNIHLVELLEQARTYTP